MKTNSSQPPTNQRFHIRRVRKGLYHVTDTTQCVEYRTSDPDRFRPSKVVRLTPKVRDNIDLVVLAEVLLRIVEEQDGQS